MKFLIVFACVVLAALAGETPEYAGPQHIPVIGPNGVPVDTAEVQHARAAHYAKKVEAHIRNGDAYAYGVAPYAYGVAPYAYDFAAHPVYPNHEVHPFHVAHPVHAYPTTAVAPAVVDGVPQETPEVHAAKSHHFAAHAEALARTGYPFAVHYRRRRDAPVVAYNTPYVTPYVTPYSSFAYSTHVPHTYGYSHPHPSFYSYPYAHHYY